MGFAMLLLMYFSGPFNFHPLKLPLQLYRGSPYERAYRHFRSNHSNSINIAAHFFGLVHILVMNFALLNEIDSSIPSSKITSAFSTATAVGWISSYYRSQLLPCRFG